MQEKDIIGSALKDFYKGNKKAEIIVHSDISEDDVIPVYYLFREYDDMPELEKLALDKCTGKTLDVGAASGCHALVLQSRGVEITPVDISQGAVEVMKERGLQTAENIDIFKLNDRKFDTILMLMNGIGLVGDLHGLDKFLHHIKNLLNPDGQIILDSSDIKYMFAEEDGSMWINMNADYYGQVKYQMEYKGVKGEEFDWLFVDFDTLEDHALKLGFNCERLFEDDHFNYLAKLTVR